MTLTFESLPNEIYFIIFSYLSSRHIWQGFFGINKRFNQLLTSNLIRHTIDLKDISYSEIVQLLEDHDENSHDYQWQVEFVSHAHAICLENDFDYPILINQWIATKINWKLSSLRTIYILPGAMEKINVLFRELEFVERFHSQLHYLHLVFDEPYCIYHSTLSNLVEKCISCPMMILEVTRGHTYQIWEYEDLYDINYSLCWIRTVYLTISLQHSSELILFLKPEALSLLEHLNVIIEQPRKDLITKRKNPGKPIQLFENDLRYVNVCETKLRSFVLRQIEFVDVLTLFNTFTFPLLETLVLVDIFDKSLHNLLPFQQLINSSKLPSLQQNRFQFLFRFPTKCEHEWVQRYSKNGWPFYNVGFHVDERIVRKYDYSSPLDFIEDAFFVYSIPFDALKYMRTMHNYELFTRHSTQIPKNFVCQNVEWLCKWTNNPTQLINSLQRMRNVKTLHCYLFGMNDQAEILTLPIHINLCHYLRSLTFRLTKVPQIGSMHYSLLQLILDVSPHLFYLNVGWRDLSQCSGKYPMIRHVYLYYGWDCVHFDVIQFNIIIPKVHYLIVGGKQFVEVKQTVDFVCDLLIDETYFCELVFLQINKNGNLTFKPWEKEDAKQTIIAKIDRLKESTTTRMKFSYHNQLSIWLC